MLREQARNIISQSVLGVEMLKLFDTTTVRVPGNALYETSGGSLDGPLLLDGMGRYNFKVHIVGNGEYASLGVLNPNKRIKEEGITLGSDFSKHPNRIFALRTGFFDKDGELILDPERFGDEENPWGDVVYLAAVTRPKMDLSFEERKAFSAANNLANELVLSSFSSNRLLEID